MTTTRRTLFGVTIFQIISTLIGFFTLLLQPAWYEPMLRGSIFAGQAGLAAVLLGVVVGGWQWLAIYVHVRKPEWAPLAYTAAGTVMIGWIAGECLVLDSFIWPHALWGGLGVLQLLLVLVMLGVLQPHARDSARFAGVEPVTVSA